MRRSVEAFLGIHRPPAEILAAESRCDPTDLQTIRQRFGSGRKQQSLTYAAFSQWLGIHRLLPAFQQLLCTAIDATGVQQITYHSFLIALDNEKRVILILMTRDLPLVVSQCLAWNTVSSSDSDVQSIVQGLQQLGSDAEVWYDTYPVFGHTLHAMIHGFRSERTVDTGPLLVHDFPRLLLSPACAFILASNLKWSWRKQWELIFSSERDGQSFQTCIGRVRNRGVTLLVLRDENGAVFGGLAPMPWQPSGRFYGDPTGFLFTLRPSLRIFKPSGSTNQNYQWCGEKFKELPNGFGFGGQVEYYGLFLDASFDSGMSLPNNTYEAPTLSSTPHFKPECIEVWLVERSEDDLLNDQPQGSVLDRYKEDQRVMSLIGKGLHSDGYRDVTSEDGL